MSRNRQNTTSSTSEDKKEVPPSSSNTDNTTPNIPTPAIAPTPSTPPPPVLNPEEIKTLMGTPQPASENWGTKFFSIRMQNKKIAEKQYIPDPTKARQLVIGEGGNYMRLTMDETLHLYQFLKDNKEKLKIFLDHENQLKAQKEASFDS